MVDTVHYFKDPFASFRLTFGPGAMQVARCLQAPELSALSPYIGGRARSAEGVQEGVPERGGGEASPYF